MDVARDGAVALEDLSIESVATWSGSAEAFGRDLFEEMFDEAHILRPVYQAAAAELIRSSLVRNDTNAVITVLSRLAANQYFLRCAVKNHAY